MKSSLLGAFLWLLLRLNSRWVLTLGRFLYNLEVCGSESLPREGPLIVVARQSSRIEIFLAAFLCSVLKEFCGLAAGPAIVRGRLFTRLSRELDMLPAFKERGLSASSLLEAYTRLQGRKIVAIGADGEVPWDGRIQPLRPGTSWLALRTRAPLVAVTLQGAYDIWPRWASRPHLTGKLVLKIGQPFYLCDAPYNRVTKSMLHQANQRLVAELERLADRSTLHSGATKDVGA